MGEFVSGGPAIFMMNDVNDADMETAFPHSHLAFLSHNEGSFFHRCQQSGKMQAEMRRRSRLLYEQRRRAHQEAIRRKGVEAVELPMYDMNSEEVTLCLEISHNDHVEMIANRSGYKGDDNISRILAETEVKIEFPDKEDHNYETPHCHRVEDLTQYMNQIMVTGRIEDVNSARIRLRRLCPLTVCFPVVDTSSDMPLSRLRLWLPRALRDGVLDFQNISVQILPPSMSPMYKIPMDGGDISNVPGPVIRISGRMCDDDEVLRACEVLREKIFDEEVGKNIVFSSHIDIPTSHWKMVVGEPDGALMVLVSKFTGAHLHFPGYNQFDELSPFTGFFCTGKPKQVIQARKLIQGLLPLQLAFDVDDSALLNSVEDSERPHTFYDRASHVTIKIARSNKEPSILLPTETRRHFVQIVTAESNVAKLFQSYRRVFKNNEDIPEFKIHDYDFMEEITAQIASHVGSMVIPCRMAPRLAGDYVFSSSPSIGSDFTGSGEITINETSGKDNDDSLQESGKIFDSEISTHSHSNSYLEAGDRTYQREYRFGRHGHGRFNRDSAMRRNHPNHERRFPKFTPFGHKSVLPLKSQDSIPNRDDGNCLTRLREYEHRENVEFGCAQSLNSTDEMSSSLITSAISSVSSRCITPNEDRKRDIERRYSANSTTGEMRRGPLRQRNYPESSYYGSGPSRRNVSIYSSFSLRRGDENNRPMKIELQYRAPAQRSEGNENDENDFKSATTTDSNMCRSTLPLISPMQKESLLPTPPCPPLSHTYYCHPAYHPHSERQSHQHQLDHQPRSYADITRRWEQHGINVMDLIKLASEDPQSHERNMDLRKKEGERDEDVNNDGMSYAKVLERRRPSAGEHDDSRNQWMPYCGSDTQTTKAFPVPLSSSRRSSTSSQPSSHCLPSLPQRNHKSQYEAMENFLASIRCNEYTGCFIKNKVELSRIYTLGDEDLQRIGVTDENARRHIQKAAQQIYVSQHLAGGSF